MIKLSEHVCGIDPKCPGDGRATRQPECAMSSSGSHATRRWREQDSKLGPPLGEEREYEISRQDREIASRPDGGVARPHPTRSSTARQIGNTAEPDCWMICAEPRATWAVELLAQRAGRVIPFVTPAPLQLGHDQIDEIGESLRRHRIGEVEPVHVGFLDPSDQLFCDLFGRADYYRPATADS